MLDPLLQFVEEDDITPLVEALPETPDKLRPAQPEALQFTSWDQVKVGIVAIALLNACSFGHRCGRVSAVIHAPSSRFHP